MALISKSLNLMTLTDIDINCDEFKNVVWINKRASILPVILTGIGSSPGV